MSEKKKILISVICVIGLLLCLLSAIIKEEKATKEEKENMLEAMECWAKGEEYYGDCLEDWEYSKHTEVEEMAIKTAKELKSDPQKLVFFLYNLEIKNLKKLSIQNEISSLTLGFEEKISLHSVYYSARLRYYQLPEITQSEVEAYVKQNGSKELHLKSGKGGFYDGKKDTHYYDEVGLAGSPLYDGKSTSYFGDFKCERKFGVKLNFFYQIIMAFFAF